ncbi:MAG: 3-phosphoshikimate 1-carboxyvinyltransferase [Bacteroidales bacterium]|nr:3-phosphoshikimate 1-carboxyvinyltransferase [Bacteroidales bacterium]
MRIGIGISKASGTVAAPPSKSYAHRLLIVADLYCGRCGVEGIALSDDISRTLECLKALENRDATVTLPCGESGSTLRFMVPIALALGGDFIFRCSPRLRERGIAGYDTMFREQGISFSPVAEGFRIAGKLDQGTYRIDVSSSSQYLTGLLLALPMLEGTSRIITEGKLESAAYIDITLDVLRRAGILIAAESDGFTVTGPQRGTVLPGGFRVEGDWSNAAFLEGFNLIGGDITLTGLNPDSCQGDRRYREYFKALSDGFARIDIAEQIDLGPVLFALAALLHGAEFTGTRRLAIKESDRAEAMLRELAKFGVRSRRENNSVTIYGSQLHSPSEPLEGHNDHRIVMALCLLLSRFGGCIDGAEAVKKSFPDYFDVIEKLGIKIERYADQR